MKEKRKISLSKKKVARLNSIFGGNDGTGGPQTQKTTSKVIIICSKPGQKSKNGDMACPKSKRDTTPCL